MRQGPRTEPLGSPTLKIQGEKSNYLGTPKSKQQTVFTDTLEEYPVSWSLGLPGAFLLLSLSFDLSEIMNQREQKLREQSILGEGQKKGPGMGFFFSPSQFCPEARPNSSWGSALPGSGNQESRPLLEGVVEDPPLLFYCFVHSAGPFVQKGTITQKLNLQENPIYLSQIIGKGSQESGEGRKRREFPFCDYFQAHPQLSIRKQPKEAKEML